MVGAVSTGAEVALAVVVRRTAVVVETAVIAPADVVVASFNDVVVSDALAGGVAFGPGVLAEAAIPATPSRNALVERPAATIRLAVAECVVLRLRS